MCGLRSRDLLALFNFIEQRNVLDGFGRREGLEVGVDVSELLIRRYLFRVGWHFARRTADVSNQILCFERSRHNPRSSSATLASVTMALIAADSSKKDLAVARVPVLSGVALLSRGNGNRNQSKYYDPVHVVTVVELRHRLERVHPA